jgi:hypothetical protein
VTIHMVSLASIRSIVWKNLLNLIYLLLLLLLFSKHVVINYYCYFGFIHYNYYFILFMFGCVDITWNIMLSNFFQTGTNPFLCYVYFFFPILVLELEFWVKLTTSKLKALFSKQISWWKVKYTYRKEININ